MININGKIYNGQQVIINNGRVIIDGKEIEQSDKVINISVEGNIEKLEGDSIRSLLVKGDVGSIKVGSADITCKNVNGNVTTGSGDIECGAVSGNIQTGSGDVDVNGTVGGDVRTGSGDIKRR